MPTKTIKNVKVFIADGIPDRSGNSYLAKNIDITNDNVPLTVNFDYHRTIGRAKIRLEGNEVKADISFSEQFEDIYNGYPCIGGSIDMQKKIHISSISISPNGNMDERIKNLGEQDESK